MSIDKKIAFLGAGNMAGALIKGLLSAKACAPSQILATDVRADRLAQLKSDHQITVSDDNKASAA